MVTPVRYSVARRSGGRVTLCAVCTVHEVTRSICFLVEPQNQGRRFISGLASKPLGQFSLVWPQNRWLGFPGLCLKTKQTLVCRLRHKMDEGRMAREMH
jgi:hypothetical protein